MKPPRLLWKLLNYPPRIAYAVGLGRVMGPLVLLLTTEGRKTGKPRVTPLQYEEVDGDIIVAASSGLSADWVRNMLANSCVDLRRGSDRIEGIAEVSTDVGRIADFLELRYERHPRMIPLIMRMEGVRSPPSRETLEILAADLALVVISPERSSPVGLSGWKSRVGRAAYLHAYDDALALFDVEYSSRLLPTRFGDTHTIVWGQPDGSPLLLFPAATGAGAVQWFANAAALGESHRVFAFDVLGAPGQGTQTAPISNRSDCVDWVTDLIDAIGLERADLIGSSQGGWFVLNAAIGAPHRVGRMALLAPAASLLAFRTPVAWALRIGPYMPAWAAGWSMQANFGRRYKVDEGIIEMMTMALAHFQYQDGAIFPNVFTDEELRELITPTLVLTGDKELIYDARAALDRCDRLIPNVETDLIANAGHLLNIEKPTVVTNRILEFFGAPEESSGARAGEPNAVRS